LEAAVDELEKLRALEREIEQQWQSTDHRRGRKTYMEHENIVRRRVTFAANKPVELDVEEEGSPSLCWRCGPTILLDIPVTAPDGDPELPLPEAIIVLLLLAAFFAFMAWVAMQWM
jgi:hypothetical protein